MYYFIVYKKSFHLFTHSVIHLFIHLLVDVHVAVVVVELPIDAREHNSLKAGLIQKTEQRAKNFGKSFLILRKIKASPTSTEPDFIVVNSALQKI